MKKIILIVASLFFAYQILALIIKNEINKPTRLNSYQYEYIGSRDHEDAVIHTYVIKDSDYQRRIDLYDSITALYRKGIDYHKEKDLMLKNAKFDSLDLEADKYFREIKRTPYNYKLDTIFNN